MPGSRPLTILCITTYEKGQEFMRECKRQGCRVLLLTAEKLRNAHWPRESIEDAFYLPAEIALPDIVKAVTHLAARTNWTGSWRSMSTTWRLRPRCASTCASRGWA